MEKKFISNSIAFLLFALMVLKVSSFHVYTHEDTTQDSVENCAICDLAIENPDIDFIVPVPLASTTTVPLCAFNEQPVIKDITISSFFLRNSFFGRPPPQVG
ncbi:hypothetical protein EJ994_05190 [Maribacter sp. MJ134]|uniref:hypothetical protein n=1 Tax=Maribacter sp. MJ134 TaxID=2496865 RepID=UPI000F83D52D|nr:hypothetical protein [Maribacter sp. MJ134]AZQ58235.1 hypothetical protein EJ994_05190 [Maribacter sp. MJ134]